MRSTQMEPAMTVLGTAATAGSAEPALLLLGAGLRGNNGTGSLTIPDVVLCPVVFISVRGPIARSLNFCAREFGK
jgi:hypothetical protein